MDRFGQPIYPGEVLQAGIGQGFDLATVLQVANAYAAVANGGKLYQPQVVREVRGPDGTVVRPFEPKLIRKVKAPTAALTTMRQAARRVVTSRHTYNLADLPIVVAGKTGTAEFGVAGQERRACPYSHWFAGFVPKNAWKKDNPSGDVTKPDSQLAFAVFTYDSRTLGNVATEVGEVLPAAPLRDREGLPDPRAPEAHATSTGPHLMGVLRVERSAASGTRGEGVGGRWRDYDIQLTVYAVLLAAIGLAMAYSHTTAQPGRPSSPARRSPAGSSGRGWPWPSSRPRPCSTTAGCAP